MSPRLRVMTLIKITVVLLAFSVALSTTSCGPIAKINASDSSYTVKWIDWNILLPPGTTSGAGAKILEDIKAGIEARLKDSIKVRGHRMDSKVIFRTHYCICDSLLIHLEADLDLWGTTGSNTTPPKTDPGASGGGGTRVAYNETISLPNSFPIVVDTTSKEKPGGHRTNEFLLAIMDTGLDPKLFSGITGLFWADPTVAYSNFLIGANPHNYWDDNEGKHGSAVTALALNQFRNSMLPSLMILKVLNKDGKGSAFTVSCALSYAAQNKAQLINASLGYLGEPDEILNHYVQRIADSGNYIIAAAGNVAGKHDTTKLCTNDPNPEGLLKANKLFYPACYLTAPQRLIAVTGLNTAHNSCFYQNYSNHYIHIGMVNTQNCCAYDVAFLRDIEGSSFATPIVTGRIGNFMIADPMRRYGLMEIYVGIRVKNGATNATIDGQLIE